MLLEDIIKPVVESVGYEFWGLELSGGGRHTILRVYIESKNGISVDDCKTVSRQISGVLDVEDPIKEEYTLEVSSPGLDRKLFKLEHFEQMKGAFVRIALKSPFEGKKKFKGMIKGTEDKEVVITIANEEYIFPFESIDKAHVVQFV